MADLACTELLHHITEYLDGAIDRELDAAIREHIAGCDDCTAAIEQIRTVVALSRADPGDAQPMDPAMRRRLVEAWMLRPR
jgi:anti-sigma factor RsiW